MRFRCFFMTLVEPDKPTYSFDASTFDQMPPELQEQLKVFYDQQEVEKQKIRRQEEFEYQDLLARTLLSRGLVQTEVSEVLTELRDEDDAIDSMGLALRSQFDFGSDNVYWPDVEVFAGCCVGEMPSVHLFYQDLFDMPENWCGPGSPSILVNHRDRDNPFQLYDEYPQFLKAVGEETSFIYMGDFWRPKRKDGTEFLIAKRNAMINIGGFCVDIDRVDDSKGGHFPADYVMNSLIDVLEVNPEITPNYLMLSGTGIQLWYLFGKKIPLLSAKKSPRRDKFQKVLRLLYEWFDGELPKNRFKVDIPCATISHAFRAPGSQSKLRYPTRLFVLGDYGGWVPKMIDPVDLSDFLGGPLKPYDCEEWNQKEYVRLKEDGAFDRRNDPATSKQYSYLEKLCSMGCIEQVPDECTIKEADLLIKRGEIVFTKRSQLKNSNGFIKTNSGHSIARRPRDPKLYEYTLKRLYHDTPTGSRYNALFGLAGLGWNCGIPKSRVQRDMENLLDTDWAREVSKDGLPLQESDVRAAMRGYNRLGALRPREMLEHRLQWSYGPPAKRNGRTRDQHLQSDPLSPCVAIREATFRVRAEAKAGNIAAYLAENPSASKNSVCKALGMSKTTVSKYWLEACEKAGVADTRSGNHRPF